jgi:hypothetical protein
MLWGTILRWIDLAVLVGVLALMGRVRLHLSHFSRFFAILLALSTLTAFIFVWTAQQRPADGE